MGYGLSQTAVGLFSLALGATYSIWAALIGIDDVLLCKLFRAKGFKARPNDS